MSDPKVVIVDRTKLVLSLEDDVAAAMAYPDGRYDVMGAILNQAYGVPMHKLENMGYPSDVQECHNIPLPDFVRVSKEEHDDKSVTQTFLEIADEEGVPPEQKEGLLKKYALDNFKIILEFVN